MKKKLVSLALVATMTASMIMSAFAASADVEIAYSAYNAMLEAMENTDLEALANTTEAYLESFNELDEAENEELWAMFDGESEDVAMEMLSNYVYACSIVEIGKIYDAFVVEKNVVNAKELIDMYESIESDDEFKEVLADYFTDFDTVYEEAVAVTEANVSYELYVLYMDLLDAMESGDVDSINTAIEAFVEPFNAIEEEQVDALGEIFEKDGEEVVSEMFSNYVTANVYVEFSKRFDDFTENCNGETAKAFVEYYDSIYNDPDYKDEALEQLIDDHYYGYESVYESAKQWSEAQDIANMYDDIVAGLESVDLDSVENLLAEFGDVLENMEEETLNILAQIYETDTETLTDKMFYDFVNANILFSIELVFDAYVDEQNVETAQALVDMYDSVYNDSSYEDEILRAMVPKFFEGIDEKYAEAKALLAGESGLEDETTVEETEKVPEKENEKATEKETTKGIAPNTGDATTAMPVVGMLAVGVAVVAMKKKEA